MMRSNELKQQHWQVDWYVQWTVSGRMNWYDFTLIHIGGEYAAYSDTIEVCLGLLGVNCTITYRRSLDFVNELTSLKDVLTARLKDEHPGVIIEDPLGVLDRLEKDNEQE